MTTIGVVRWDPITGNSASGDLGAWNRAWLGPAQYHARAPWFLTEVNSTTLTGRSDTQDVADQEILWASMCGIDYFAFNFVPGQKNFFSNPVNGQPYEWIDANASLTYHRSSTQKARMKYCLNLIANYGTAVPVKDDTSGWATVQAYIVAAFQDPTYMTVLSGRPLLYLYDPDGFVVSPYASNATNAKAALDSLRSATQSAIGKDPYIVGGAFVNITSYTSLGLDGAHYYSRWPNANGETWASYSGRTEATWDTFGSTPQVPLACVGVDTNCMSDTVVSGSHGDPPPTRLKSIAPTDAELATHVSNCLAWIAANPTKAPADTMMIYAWSEPTECVSPLMPKLGDRGSTLLHLARKLGRLPNPSTVGGGSGLPMFGGTATLW